jgi:hypothetical protein
LRIHPNGKAVGETPTAAVKTTALLKKSRLYIYVIGKVMFESSVKPNQTKSNLFEISQTIPSREIVGEAALSRQVGKGLEMRRFDAILLG